MAPISSSSAWRQVRCCTKTGAKVRMTAAKQAGRCMATSLGGDAPIYRSPAPPPRPCRALRRRHACPEWPKSSSVVHPLNQCEIWDGGDSEAARLPMTPSTTRDERMPVIVPVGRGSRDRLLDLGPALETAALQRQRAQHLPPRLDQVQVGGILGLEHKFPARMQQAEQQHVGRAVDVEVVEHGVDPLDGRIDPALDRAQEIDPVDGGATLISQREGRAGRRLQGAEDVTGDTTPAVVDLLLGSFRLGAGWPHQPSTRIALAGLRTHLVQADNDAARRCFGVELLDRPLFRAKSGSTRSPNQVSSCRHLRPSWMKISLIRLRRMAIPCWLRWTTRRSSVQQANGRPRSAGRVRAAVITARRCSAE